MAGTPAPALDANQATSILNTVKDTLRIVRTSPLRTEPGQPATATLVPAVTSIDATELVAGVLNLGVIVKDVVYQDAKVVSIPGSGKLDGDDLLTGNTNLLAGGQPFPLPVAIPTSTAQTAASNIPGTLQQIIGTVALPRLSVGVTELQQFPLSTRCPIPSTGDFPSVFMRLCCYPCRFSASGGFAKSFYISARPRARRGRPPS